MKKEFAADRLDVRAFAQEGADLAAEWPLGACKRLMAETAGDAASRLVTWRAQGEWRQAEGRPGQPWLHLQASAVLPMTCQRCLGPVEVSLQVDRSFRFVADERTAEQEDDEAEEDLLVLEREFDLLQLLEDELLLELPVVPRHDACPVDVKLAVADKDFDPGEGNRPNPFAALAQLKGNKGR